MPRPVVTATDHVTIHAIISVQVHVQIVQGGVGISLRCFNSCFDLLFRFLLDTLEENNTTWRIETALFFFDASLSSGNMTVISKIQGYLSFESQTNFGNSDFLLFLQIKFPWQNQTLILKNPNSDLQHNIFIKKPHESSHSAICSFNRPTLKSTEAIPRFSSEELLFSFSNILVNKFHTSNSSKYTAIPWCPQCLQALNPAVSLLNLRLDHESYARPAPHHVIGSCR